MAKASSGKKGSIKIVLDNQGKHGKELVPSQESSSKVELQKTTSIIKFIPILLLLLVSFAVYFNALSGDFVYDDEHQIVKNPWLRDFGNIPTIFSKSVWSFGEEENNSNYYRPMMHTVYLFNYHIFGLKPWGFHLVNILFHCGASVLVFLSIRKLLTEDRTSASPAYLSPPFIAAMLFATHPIHTEAVTWIAGLPDVAFAFFYLLSFYFYMLFRDGLKRGYLLSILSFSVATLFKEPAVTLPILLIAYDHFAKKSDETLFAGIKRYIPYVVVSCVYLLVRYYALRSFAPLESYTVLSTYEFIINVFPLFTEYLTSLLWPLNLNSWHTFHPIFSLNEAKGMISIVVAVLFFIVAVTTYRKNRLFFFGLLLYVIPLLPVFYIKAISGKPFAERYLYLPSAGFVFLLAIFLSWANEKLPRAFRTIPIIFLLIGGVFSVGTITRNNVWKNNFNLWSDTVKKSPDSAEAHYNLGIVYTFQGLWDRAMAQYRYSLELQPDSARAHTNLGFVYKSLGKLEEAAKETRYAVSMRPENTDYRNNLGDIYMRQGKIDEAVREFQGALKIKPNDIEAHNNLAAAYVNQGRSTEAEKEFGSVLSSKKITETETIDAHYNRGIHYMDLDKLDDAVKEFQAVLKINPNDTETYNNLAAVYLRQGKLEEASTEFKHAVTLRPDDPNIHHNRGIVLMKQGKPDEAAIEFQAALNLRPDSDLFRKSLNRALALKGNRK